MVYSAILPEEARYYLSRQVFLWFGPVQTLKLFLEKQVAVHQNELLDFVWWQEASAIPACSLHGLMLQESDLKRLHEDAIKNDPFISQALGPNAKIERMKAASLRLGGQGLKTTYDDHLVIIGDAAGHIDPLTGEGIHTAIMVSVTPPGFGCPLSTTEHNGLFGVPDIHLIVL